MNIPPVAPSTNSSPILPEGAKTGNANGGSMGKDEFVKLLVAQMSNQDPLNPMDGKDLAVQLAQFSNVEQLLNINAKMDEILKHFNSAAE